MIDLKNMSLEQLKSQKLDWWQQAIEDGSIAACSFVCRELGESLSTRYGPKYLYVEGDLTLHVDDYKHFSVASWKDKIVMSSHPSDHIFIPGQWFDIVKYRIEYALKQRRQKETEKKAERKIAERQKLLEELSV